MVAVEAVEQGALLLAVRVFPGGVNVDDDAVDLLPQAPLVALKLKFRLVGS